MIVDLGDGVLGRRAGGGGAVLMIGLRRPGATLAEAPIRLKGFWLVGKGELGCGRGVGFVRVGRFAGRNKI